MISKLNSRPTTPQLFHHRRVGVSRSIGRLRTYKSHDVLVDSQVARNQFTAASLTVHGPGRKEVCATITSKSSVSVQRHRMHLLHAVMTGTLAARRRRCLRFKALCDELTGGPNGLRSFGGAYDDRPAGQATSGFYRSENSIPRDIARQEIDPTLAESRAIPACHVTGLVVSILHKSRSRRRVKTERRRWSDRRCH